MAMTRTDARLWVFDLCISSLKRKAKVFAAADLGHPKHATIEDASLVKEEMLKVAELLQDSRNKLAELQVQRMKAKIAPQPDGSTPGRQELKGHEAAGTEGVSQAEAGQ